MRVINLIQFGIGRVGYELLQQVLQNSEKLKNAHITLRYCGMFSSTGGIFKRNGLTNIDISHFPQNAETNPESVIGSLSSSHIIIDTTASDKMYPILLNALKEGSYVVFSNKKNLTNSQKQYDEVLELGGNKVFYETTVGAGLPIISTIKTLLATGDHIISIEGCFSGTLGYIFSSLEREASFSEAVNQAFQKGYTEPDPRDDLGGLDVARKALILARLMGKKLELSDIKVEKLYSKSVSKLSAEEFLKNLSSLDLEFARRLKMASKKGKTLRYVAKVSNTCQVGLREVDKSSDIGNLEGSDNIISIKTKRYFDNPLVIKGPGAGPEVTAAGVFGDIVQIINSINLKNE